MRLLAEFHAVYSLSTESFRKLVKDIKYLDKKLSMRYRQHMLDSFFHVLGFNPTETKAYLGLAELGKSTAQGLAKRVGIPRTTAYSTLENLVARGLVSVERRGATTFFTANKPESIVRMVQRERDELAAKEATALELTKLLAPVFQSKFYSVPKIQFFEGQLNVTNMLYDFNDTWFESMQKYDDVLWGYQDHSFVEHYRKWLEDHWEAKPDNLSIKLLSNVAKVEESLRGAVKGREIRSISDQAGFSSSIWICGDYIVLLMTAQPPHYAFQLHDAVFASNLRSVFRLLWSAS